MSWEHDPVKTAIEEALRPQVHLETDWELPKLTKRLRDYVLKASQRLSFNDGASLFELFKEFAHASYSSVYQALGDRDWIKRVDFLLVLDAAVAETFPRQVLESTPRKERERLLLACNDTAFDEERYLPKIWDVAHGYVSSTKGAKRVYEAAANGRRAASARVDVGKDGAPRAFVGCWIHTTVRALARNTYGQPEEILPCDDAVPFFRALLADDGALPVILTTKYGRAPEEWQFVPYCVHAAYAACKRRPGGERRANKRPRTLAAVKKEELAEEESGPGALAVGVPSKAEQPWDGPEVAEPSLKWPREEDPMSAWDSWSADL